MGSADLTARASNTRILALVFPRSINLACAGVFLGRKPEDQEPGVRHDGRRNGCDGCVYRCPAGGTAAFWGRGGEDAAGREMHKALSDKASTSRRFRLFQDGQSSVSGVLVDGTGERQIVNFRGQFPEQADWLPPGEVGAASAVLADPRWPSGAVALSEPARKLFRRFSMPTSPIPMCSRRCCH